jgi:hypothetical protein
MAQVALHQLLAELLSLSIKLILQLLLLPPLITTPITAPAPRVLLAHTLLLQAQLRQLILAPQPMPLQHMGQHSPVEKYWLV